MHFVEILRALVLGVVEGVTEFLPVSSTGHLILAARYLDFERDSAKTFEVFIQLGAILAVVWEYRRTLFHMVLRWQREPDSRHLLVSLVVASLPAAILGVIFHGWIKEHLFSPVTVAWALIVGGVAILAIERFLHPQVRVRRVEDMDPRTAFAIGLAQVLALFPGVSRSGATIMGGLVVGLSRSAATEFSFFLAIPVMLAATLLDLSGSASTLTRSDAGLFAVGFLAAFISALVVVRLFLRFVARRSFEVFAWYRIGVGVLVLLYLGGMRPG
jgi:undecaprenyl-diphosphatase